MLPFLHLKLLEVLESVYGNVPGIACKEEYEETTSRCLGFGRGLCRVLLPSHHADAGWWAIGHWLRNMDSGQSDCPACRCCAGRIARDGNHDLEITSGQFKLRERTNLELHCESNRKLRVFDDNQNDVIWLVVLTGMAGSD